FADSALANKGNALRLFGLDAAEGRRQLPAPAEEPAVFFDRRSIQIGIARAAHDTALRLASSVTCQMECSRAIHIRSKSTRNRYRVDDSFSSQSSRQRRSKALNKLLTCGNSPWSSVGITFWIVMISTDCVASRRAYARVADAIFS